MIKNIRKIASQNFSNWNNALLTKNPKIVAAIYSENCTFLPTLSSDFKKGRRGAKKYFEHFLRKKPCSTIIKESVHIIAADTYVHSGLYNFSLGNSERKNIAKARFTFVWQKNKNNIWQILHHHSSLRLYRN